jgi:ketosteroid isomerase-like protein
MKKIFISTLILLVSVISFAQHKEVDAAKAILKQYKDAVEKLDVTGTEKLFTADSKVFESGGSEGNYAHYLEHHLGPEFKVFKSFKYHDYKVDVTVDGNYAFATEAYTYVIVVAKDNTEVKRKGVSTSVLKKANGEWKIMVSHNSSRR